MGIIVRLLFVLAAFITSFFVARDATNFAVVQMLVAVVLFTLLVFIIVFLPEIKNKFLKRRKR